MAKPDFTGTWNFNAARSSLQTPVPESATFVINHREPLFSLERTQVFGGNSDTFSIELTIDGAPAIRDHAGFRIKANVRWEGETLLFDSLLSRDDQEATNIVRYQLAEAGQVLIAEEQFNGGEHTHENKWIFDRK